MSARLTTLVERYLEERRRLGFDMRTTAYRLRSLADHVRAVAHRGPLTIELMVQWARQDSRASRDPATWARRLKGLRSFTRWLQQFEPRTEVPDDAVFGRVPGRQAPHIPSEREIMELLAAARRLDPSPGLHGVLFETIFGLIACTGMRVSEAVGLRNGDVDLKHALLTIRRTKFAKSRQLPIHASAVRSLGQYRWMRDLAGVSPDAEAPFFVDPRRLGEAIGTHQVRHVFRRLRQSLGWSNRGAHHAARIHDLRHAFVVRRIVLWQQQGVDIDEAMLALSTYVGHAMVTNTYWYLQAVPELMALSARRFELCMPERADE